MKCGNEKGYVLLPDRSEVNVILVHVSHELAQRSLRLGAETESLGDVSLESGLELSFLDASPRSVVNDLLLVSERNEEGAMLVDGGVGEVLEGVHATSRVH